LGITSTSIILRNILIIVSLVIKIRGISLNLIAIFILFWLRIIWLIRCKIIYLMLLMINLLLLMLLLLLLMLLLLLLLLLMLLLMLMMDLLLCLLVKIIIFIRDIIIWILLDIHLKLFISMKSYWFWTFTLYRISSF